MKIFTILVEETLTEIDWKKKLGRLKADLKSGAKLKRKSYRWGHRGGKKLGAGKGLSRSKVKRMARTLKKTRRRVKGKIKHRIKIGKTKNLGLRRRAAVIRKKIRSRGGLVRQ